LLWDCVWEPVEKGICENCENRCLVDLWEKGICKTVGKRVCVSGLGQWSAVKSGLWSLVLVLV
jgi:hypothetical protein